MNTKKSLKFMSIVGARPNFMKVASLAAAIDRHNRLEGNTPIEHAIVHTGQHYDEEMSRQFFTELAIPQPHYNLGVGSGSHAVQTAEIMTRFEPVLLKEQPDALLVVGDVNSTIACALVGTKTCYGNGCSRQRPLIAHIEAGLRSRDRTMPEEINRILTDALSDLLFVTEQDAIANLEYEGVSRKKIHFVGNVMIDTLISHREKARTLRTLEHLLKTDCRDAKLRERFQRSDRQKARYGLVTLHRPGNVDAAASLGPLLECVRSIASRIPLIFPLHPRTRKNLVQFGLQAPDRDRDTILYTKPLGYLEFLDLLQGAALVLTDSGGIQEEATFLQVPCVTLRNNTERPVTITMGTNYLVGTKPEMIAQTAFRIIGGRRKKGSIPPLWDGEAGARVIGILEKTILNNS
jgi:UDP-N-acetylglucosamine 2-epimerase (non-hydrolysing)